MKHTSYCSLWASVALLAGCGLVSNPSYYRRRAEASVPTDSVVEGPDAAVDGDVPDGAAGDAADVARGVLAEEIPCNGFDDDGDLMTDEVTGPDGSPVTITCGAGASLRTVPICERCEPSIPTPPPPDSCSTSSTPTDDNGNGVIDEQCAAACDALVTTVVPTGDLAGKPRFASVAAAIAARTPLWRTICVVTNFMTGGGVCAPTTYTGRFEVDQDNLRIIGGFRSDSTFSAEPQCRPTLRVETPGIEFGVASSLNTQLFNVHVEIENPAGGATDSQAINIKGGATLASVSVDLGADAESLRGIVTRGAVPTVLRDVVMTASRGTRSADTVTGIASSGTGPLLIEGLRMTLGNTRMLGDVYGVSLDGPRQVVLINNSVMVRGSGVRAEALSVRGTVGSVFVSGGAYQAFASTTATSDSHAVHFDGCSASGNVFVLNASVGGGGAGRDAEGVRVRDCNAVIARNEKIVGRDEQGGANSFGVHCTGTSARCAIVGNSRVLGLNEGATVPAPSSDNSAGVHTSNGAIVIVIDNGSRSTMSTRMPGISAGPAAVRSVGVEILNNGSYVVRNRVLPSQLVLGSTAPRRVAAGIWLGAEGDVAVGNVVRHAEGHGIVVDASITSLIGSAVHSNTVVREPLINRVAQSGGVVMLNSGSTPAIGLWANNIVVCLGPATIDTYGLIVAETTPRFAQNNLLYGCGMPLRSNGMDVPATALPSWLVGTVLADPAFDRDEEHITAASPALNAGTGLGLFDSATTSILDIDGVPRPIGPMDIGADEYAP